MTTDLDVSASPAADPMVGRTGPARRPWRRALIVAVAAAVGVVGVISVRVAMAGDDPTPVVHPDRPATAGPLIIPAEQVFINAGLGRVAAVRVDDDAWCVTHRPC